MKIFISLLMALFFIAGQALADEESCEGLVGAAYGLCNAYCNSLNCESGEQQASERACQAVRDNYYKRTGEELTCLEETPSAGVPCPCFTAEELIKAFADDVCFILDSYNSEEWLNSVWNFSLNGAWVGDYPSYPWYSVGCGLLTNESEVHVADLSEEEILSCLSLLDDYAINNFCLELF